ncbi:MAG: hypothetical protein ACLQDV_12190 [Candidatus Binataceae bacterium]
MAKEESETFAESELLDELLASKRSLQTHAAQCLSDKVQILCRLSKPLNDVAPDPPVREQFERSFDALEERLAKVAGLLLKSKRSSDFDKRLNKIGDKGRDTLMMIDLWIRSTFKIDVDAPLTAAQRRQVKALIRNGLEGVKPDPGPYKDIVIQMLYGMIASK